MHGLRLCQGRRRGACRRGWPGRSARPHVPDRGGPGSRALEARAGRARSRRRCSTRTRSARRCRCRTSPRRCSSWRRSRSPGPSTSRAGTRSSRADLAELVARRPVRRAPAPPGRPLDCSLDSSRAQSPAHAAAGRGRGPLRGVSRNVDGHLRQAGTVNRLAAETSPYLLQHAGNPVDWYPWGAEALERARRRSGRSSSRSATAPATGAT